MNQVHLSTEQTLHIDLNAQGVLYGAATWWSTTHTTQGSLQVHGSEFAYEQQSCSDGIERSENHLDHAT